ncbi:MAG: purine-nucleoside phosphorylase [Clostridiales bacterium]|nr:purine-nucleoside phosphorylase [Candidatus Equinaster intestinalis]
MIPTPHISADLGDFAKTVLMPGDPLRSKFIAENFLSNARLVNNVRGVQGYTGDYDGIKVSVMASGMGMPSIGIYSYELYNFYGVENIIRVGSAGAIDENVKIRDIIIGKDIITDSAFAKNLGFPADYMPKASNVLVEKAENIAKKMGANCHTGMLFSTDVYYADVDFNALNKKGALAVEMEAAALYLNAEKAQKNALAICTVSNNILTGVELPSSERETTFTQMMELALKIAKEMEK